MLAEHDDLHKDDPYILEELLSLIERRADKAVAFFYAMLFLEEPAIRDMFPVAMDEQRDRLFRALTKAVRDLRAPDRAVPQLQQLGRDHRKYGVRDEHYDVVGRALLAALRKYAEEVWVPELEAVWWRCYNYMARVMIDAANASAGSQPAVWEAQIVAHERRALDLAVITLRVDRPYPYNPGQYATVETPYRPRMWRQYSLATAPASEAGEEFLELHVKAIDGGWVSGPLVWRAQIGETLRLGPARGDLAIDQESGRDIVMVAGGTGLAPLKALLEDAVRWNNGRRITLFFGVRKTPDLYDLAALHRLAVRHPWLRVVPCVSEDDSYVGAQGLVNDVLAREARDHGDWRQHDVLLCGSPAMVRATLRTLSDLGVPSAQIRFDAFGDIDPQGAEIVDLRRARTMSNQI